MMTERPRKNGRPACTHAVARKSNRTQGSASDLLQGKRTSEITYNQRGLEYWVPMRYYHKALSSTDSSLRSTRNTHSLNQSSACLS